MRFVWLIGLFTLPYSGRLFADSNDLETLIIYITEGQAERRTATDASRTDNLYNPQHRWFDANLLCRAENAP